MTLPISRVSRSIWPPNDFTIGERAIPEETAVAMTYDGGSCAVMMATPRDLEDFAFGFSLTEGIVSSIDEIEGLEIIEGSLGIVLRMRLAKPRSTLYSQRRRYLAGPHRMRALWHRNPCRGSASAEVSLNRPHRCARRNYAGPQCAGTRAGDESGNARRA